MKKFNKKQLASWINLVALYGRRNTLWEMCSLLVGGCLRYAMRTDVIIMPVQTVTYEIKNLVNKCGAKPRREPTGRMLCLLHSKIF